MGRPKKTLQTVHAVGYIRVSTAEQAENGVGLDAQRARIEAECERRGWTLVAIHEDRGASGKALKGRPGLAAALAMIEDGAADTLVVAKLDRLSRSLIDFATLLQSAHDQGWNLVALDLGIDLGTPAGEFLASVMASAAQWERRIIGARTKDALAIKKAQGVRLGRPISIDPLVAERIRTEHAAGLTLTAIAEGLNREGVPTARGGAKWYPSTVRAVVN
jgi:DNA invertase Pin-like site-specific DNA recombinase